MHDKLTATDVRHAKNMEQFITGPSELVHPKSFY